METKMFNSSRTPPPNHHITHHEGWSRRKPRATIISPQGPQPRWPSDTEHAASAAGFNHFHGLKRKQQISAGTMKSAFTLHRDVAYPQTFSKEIRNQDNKRRKVTSYSDEVRDMPPSSYSATDIREQDDPSYIPMEDTRKAAQLKQKLAHRLIGRFENDSTTREDITPRQQRPVKSSDLASAMALASLAYHSPRNRGDCHKHGTRDNIVHGGSWPRPESNQYHFPRAKLATLSKEHYHVDPNPHQVDDKWICDYCHVAAFNTFQEAADHEARCGTRHQGIVANSSSGITSTPMVRDEEISDQRNSQETGRTDTDNDYQDRSSPCKNNERHDGQQYFAGSVPLSVPTTDPEWLSELNCYVRDKCVEAFSAKVDDVVKTSKRGRISLHQVGIRCVFCASQSLKDRAVAAVSYPVSISGVYESVKRWQRVHLEVCTAIPADVKNKTKNLSESSVWVPTTRQYWSDSAKALGIVDTSDGLRFAHDPERCSNADEAATSIMNSRFGSSRLKKELESKQTAKSSTNPLYIVFPEDQALVPPYVYFLMRQTQLCHFTEADRFVARSKSTIGFAGFECRHCLGHAGLGKYFPSSPKGLSTNSTSQNIYSHIMKCRRCPDEVKEKLNALKKEKYTWPRRTCGWRQAFFDQVWKRLHG